MNIQKQIETLMGQPYYTVFDFISENYRISSIESNVVDKFSTYSKYKRWSEKNSNSSLTFDKFDERILGINNEVKCIKHYGEDYSSSPIYDSE